jgi:type IV pilus assembly protein PilP
MMGKTIILLLLGVFLVSVGCGGGEAPKPTKVPIPATAPKPVAKVPAKEAPRPAAEVRVEPPPATAYTYNPQGKPNPFQPLVVEKAATPPSKKKVEEAAKKEKEKPGTPLERLDLTALKLVAVVWNIPHPRAMVEDSSGKGYILSLGTRVGKNQGQVTKITSAGVVITEKVEAADGKLRTLETPLRLYADE